MRISSKKLGGAVIAILGVIGLLVFISRPMRSPGNAPASVREKPFQAAQMPPGNAEARVDAEALQDALRESDPRRRSIDFGQRLTELFSQDPAAAINFLRTMAPGSELTEGLLIVLPKLAQTDPEGAVSLAGELVTEHEQEPVYSAVFDQIARQDLKTGAKLWQIVPEGEGRTNAVRAVAVAWADHDVLAALDWTREIKSSTDRAAATEATLFVRAKNDPERTVGLSLQLLRGASRDRVLSEAMYRLAVKDSRGAAEAIKTLPDGEVKNRATIDVARGLAAEQPQTALDWIKTLPAGELQNLALNNVLDFWSATDPSAAAKYLEQLPNDSARDSATAHLALRWGAKDPAAAVRWASQLAGATRSRAEIQAASGWAQADPAAAMRWATALSAEDPARGDAMKAAMSYWLIRDNATATGFAGTLSEEDRAQLHGTGR